MTVHIKKNLIIFENPEDWVNISAQLVKEYGPSILISWKCRRELGFSIRHHQGLRPMNGENYNELAGRYYYAPEVHLDFYDEAQQTYFVLRWIHA